MAAFLVATLASGCTSSWPRVTAISDAQFASWTPPATIDILPVDLEVWTQPEVHANPDEVRVAAESRIIGATTELLYRRGYAIGGMIDWNGMYTAPTGSSVPAIEPSMLLQTVDSLASYGSAMEVTPREMPVPFLPARLGEHTGSEATLYVGGWGFVGRADPGPGSKILTAVAIGIVVIGVLAIAAAISKKSDSLGKALDGAARGAGHAASAMASAGRVAMRTALQAGSAIANAAADATIDVVTSVHVDAFGRDETHLNLVSGRPEWSASPNARRTGSPAMYLEMTLVDNRTGLVRWHAHQQFPANPQNGRDVVHAVASMLASLPASASAVPAR